MATQRPITATPRKAAPTAKKPRPPSRQPGAPSQAPSIAQEIGRRISAVSKANPGRVHTPFDFLDLGSPRSVGMALMRLVRSGALRRLARGLYIAPRKHPLFGELQPSTDEIVQALSRRDGAVVQPAQAMAAKLLSLSVQVPMRVIYETDGPSRTVKVGLQTIQLKHRPPRQVRSATPMSSLVFAALRSVGKANVNEARVAHLRETLSEKDRAALLKDLPLAPAWMRAIQRLAEDIDLAGTPNLLFTYPSALAQAGGYIAKQVKLEFGALTNQQPTGTHGIEALLAKTPGIDLGRAYGDLKANVEALARDYATMAPMFIGVPIEFAVMLQRLQTAERQLNDGSLRDLDPDSVVFI